MRTNGFRAIFAAIILAAQATAADRPNLVFMIADDCTYPGSFPASPTFVSLSQQN